jgi:hypothetical protein
VRLEGEALGGLGRDGHTKFELSRRTEGRVMSVKNDENIGPFPSSQRTFPFLLMKFRTTGARTVYLVYPESMGS